MNSRHAWILLLALTAAACHSATTGAGRPEYGYSDTPLLPHQRWRVHDSARPLPPVVDPRPFAEVPPPTGTMPLFDGTDLSQWKSNDGAARWRVAEGFVEINGTGGIETKLAFGDCHLHLEWATPREIVGHGQERGNSGVFFMGRYEVQILDSYDNPTYADGQAAALYGQAPPTVNASRAPGEWQSYDIVFRAPRFEGEKLVTPANVTVVHNGILVHDRTPFLGATRHRDVATYSNHAAELPLALQDHGAAVRFRNIWIARL